jgi:hypothetical protein
MGKFLEEGDIVDVHFSSNVLFKTKLNHIPESESGLWVFETRDGAVFTKTFEFIIKRKEESGKVSNESK